jgi:hypothetical protein
MTWTKGFNFRQTAGFVTDGINETYCRSYSNGDGYPVTRNGVTFGWDANYNGLTDRDRLTADNLRNPKLSGMVAMQASGSDSYARFRVDLPAAGAYRIRLAAGDAGSNNRSYWRILDNTTELVASADTSLPASNYYVDATDTLHTNSALWWGKNAYVDLTFATTTFIFELVRPTALSSVIAHIQLQQIPDSGNLAEWIEEFTAPYATTQKLSFANVGTYSWVQTNRWTGDVYWDNTIRGVCAGAGAVGTAYVAEYTYTDNQYAIARIDVLSYTYVGGTLGVILQCSADLYESSGNDFRDFYAFTVSMDASGTGPYTIKLAKWVNGSETVIHSEKTYNMADGDMLSLELIDGTLYGKLNGTLYNSNFEYADSSPLTGGRPGVTASQSGLAPYYHIGYFEAGNILSAASQHQWPYVMRAEGGW